MKKVVCGFLLLFVLVACGVANKIVNSEVNTKKSYPLQYTKWVLMDKTKGSIPSLNIKEVRIYGNAGCNNYTADIKIDDTNHKITIGAVASTKMYCKWIKSEVTFLKFLSMANGYKIKENILELYKDNILLMKFKVEE